MFIWTTKQNQRADPNGDLKNLQNTLERNMILMGDFNCLKVDWTNMKASTEAGETIGNMLRIWYETNVTEATREKTHWI